MDDWTRYSPPSLDQHEDLLYNAALEERVCTCTSASQLSRDFFARCHVNGSNTKARNLGLFKMRSSASKTEENRPMIQSRQRTGFAADANAGVVGWLRLLLPDFSEQSCGALIVGIDQNDAFAEILSGVDRKIHGQGSLADTALDVTDCYNHIKTILYVILMRL